MAVVLGPRDGPIVIRMASAQDLPDLVRMAGAFIEASDVGLPFDMDYLRSSFAAQITAPDRLVLVLDVNGPRGVLCAAVSRSVWAPVPIASELLFWIDPDYRGKWALPMLRTYVAWARGIGCTRAGMVALADNPMAALYRRAGFLLSEITYSQVF